VRDTSSVLRLAGLLSFVVLALLAPASAWAAPGVRPFPLSKATATPVGITTGPDGALWFTEFDASKVGRIGLDGTISRPLRRRLTPASPSRCSPARRPSFR